MLCYIFNVTQNNNNQDILFELLWLPILLTMFSYFQFQKAISPDRVQCRNWKNQPTSKTNCKVNLDKDPSRSFTTVRNIKTMDKATASTTTTTTTERASVDNVDTEEDKDFKQSVLNATERIHKVSAIGTGYDMSKRRESNASVKSRKSSYSTSSRRGSRVDTDDDEFDQDGLPPIPNIIYR